MTFARIATGAALALSLTLGAAPGQAGTRSMVTIVNDSSTTVLSIHTAPAYRERYGSTDLLGAATMLQPGYQVRVDFDVDDAENRCVQDVVAVGSNGVRWRKRLDICAVNSWRLTD